MKKALSFVALAVMMAACSNNDDLTLSNGYGYITANVSNDVTMTTRAVQPVGDLSSWTMTYAVKDSDNKQDLPSTGVNVPAGEYTISAQSHADLASAYSAKNGYGEAYYEGTDDVTVTAGATATATVDCGKAKNARVVVTFPTETTIVSNCSLKLTTSETGAADYRADGVTLSGSNLVAYYEPSKVVSYTLTYTYNGNEKSINGTITMGAAATENAVNVKLNSNGTITISVSYDDEFTEGNNQDLTIDAATGDKVA